MRINANIDYCGAIVLLRALKEAEKITYAEMKRIAARVAIQLGADIRDYLQAKHVLNTVGKTTWTCGAVRSILTNEKYNGDVLLQKTYTDDCINRKSIKNTGQLPMYLVQNHHEGIVSRALFNAVQSEMARRKAGKSPSKKNAPTGLKKYSSKYALSERLVRGECGTLYQRCTWGNTVSF